MQAERGLAQTNRTYISQMHTNTLLPGTHSVALHHTNTQMRTRVHIRSMKHHNLRERKKAKEQKRKLEKRKKAKEQKRDTVINERN